MLQGLNTEHITLNSSACSCKASEFCYNPAGHIITGDLNIVRISKLRDILSNGPKYMEPRSFTWKQNSKLILDSIEEYARRWAKTEDVEVDTLSEWVKSVMSLVNRRVSVLSRTISCRHELVFDDPDVAAELAYQVTLTIRGRLITPFIVGSMSVGLNILIRHSFTDLWVWIMA